MASWTAPRIARSCRRSTTPTCHAGDEPSPDEDRQALFRPLFGTSFLIDDFLDESDFFGAGTVLLGSASSKTALGTAFMLAEREGVETRGPDLAAHAEFVRGLGVYDRVVTYDEIESLPDTPAVYVDMSGDAGVRGAVHRHYGDALAYDCAVGVSHWDKAFADPGPLPGPAPQLFFAPDRFRKRAEDWGPPACRTGSATRGTRSRTGSRAGSRWSTAAAPRTWSARGSSWWTAARRPPPATSCRCRASGARARPPGSPGRSAPGTRRRRARPRS